MVPVRGERSKLLALAAILLVATAWLAAGVRLGASPATVVTPTTQQERPDVVSTRDVVDVVVAPALAATRGNQIRAAELLGLNRNTLRSRIKALDIRVFRTPMS